MPSPLKADMHTTSSLFPASSLIFWGSLALSICHKKKICQNVQAVTVKLQVHSKASEGRTD